jgi:hypothetical protein
MISVRVKTWVLAFGVVLVAGSLVSVWGQAGLPHGTTQPSFRRIMAKLPAKVRTEFLESMYFVDGKLASARIGDVKRRLSPGDYQALKSSVGWAMLGVDHEGYCCSGPGECAKCIEHICDPSACKGKTGISMGQILSSVPPPDRKRFLAKLDVTGGRLTKAGVEPIRKHLGQDTLATLPDK